MTGEWQWDDVRVFLAVSREGTLSGAARVLGIDHVTAGRRIAALEKQLGAKLLSRTPDGFETTSAGQAIIKQCQSMEIAALGVERLIAGHDGGTNGSVRVTATDSMTHQIVVPLLARLREKHHELQVDLLTGVRRFDVARREADLALRLSHARPAEPGLVCRKLGVVGFSLYASSAYLARAGTPRRGGGLRGHDLIRYLGSPRSLGPAFMGESLDGARISIRSNDQMIQLQAVIDGLGIAELPCHLGDQYPALTRLWPEEAPNVRPLWLIMHEDLRRAERIRVLSAAIVDAIERDARILRWGRLPQPSLQATR